MSLIWSSQISNWIAFVFISHTCPRVFLVCTASLAHGLTVYMKSILKLSGLRKQSCKQCVNLDSLKGILIFYLLISKTLIKNIIIHHFFLKTFSLIQLEHQKMYAYNFLKPLDYYLYFNFVYVEQLSFVEFQNFFRNLLNLLFLK